MSSQPKKLVVTPEEYLAAERQADRKHEYFGGEVFAMSGASFAHVSIVANLTGHLFARLQGSSCRAFSSDLRIKVSRTGLYTYPDVVVVCGEPQFDDEHNDTLLNPRLIAEVLSPSTETYDRGKKFAHYRTLDSLAEYLLIAQDQARVEQYIRQPSGDWLLHEATQVAETIRLPSIESELSLSDVYDKIKFDQTS